MAGLSTPRSSAKENATALTLPIPDSPVASSPAPSSGGKTEKLKRHLTDVEPLGAIRQQPASLSDANFLAPPMPSMTSKRARDGELRLPSSLSFDSDMQTPHLRRQLTPRISWSTILNDVTEDSIMPSPVSRGQRTPRNFCPSPPPRTAASPSGVRSAASSPPPRPEKLRSFALRAPPTPLGNHATRVENCWEGGNRFAEDFEDVRVIGSGSFAVVYRARNRIDKQAYAIKKTKKTLGRNARRQEMLQEALALASVAIDSPCPYIVRYFASWVEDERLFIQTELCDGSLKDFMLELRQTRPHDPRVDQLELSVVIRDVCEGLAVLHGKNLVHLDVKPENILVKHASSCSSATVSKIYKIADLGLATAAMGSGCDEINEGDSRYLAREVLQGNFSDLTKADVFSLGLTCYELATNPKELPCNGEEWHHLRDGVIEVCFASHLSPSMLALIHSMINPEPHERPQCSKVLGHEAISRLRPEELQPNSGVDVQELQSQLRRQTEAAERERKKAETYWSELLHMKRQALTAPNDNSMSSAASALQVGASPPARAPRGYKRCHTS